MKDNMALVAVYGALMMVRRAFREKPARRKRRPRRNDRCPCGSGRRYKNCCLRRKSPLARFFVRPGS